MRERKLHQELSEMHKLLAVLIESSRGEVDIAEPHDRVAAARHRDLA